MTLDHTTDLQTKGFLRSLFDFSFKSIIASRVIRVLYVLWMMLLALVAIGLTIAGFEINAALGAITLLILGPLYFLFNLTFTRVFLELVMAIFAIQENTNRISPIEWPSPARARSEVPDASFKSIAENVSAGQRDIAPAN
jgi:Domain of unknown function (DUF4282)